MNSPSHTYIAFEVVNARTLAMQCLSPTLTFWAYESDDVEQLPLCHVKCEEDYPLSKHNKCANMYTNEWHDAYGSNPLHICSKTGLQAYYLELRGTHGEPNQAHRLQILIPCKNVSNFLLWDEYKKILLFDCPEFYKTIWILNLKSEIFISVESPDNPKNGKYNRVIL